MDPYMSRNDLKNEKYLVNSFIIDKALLLKFLYKIVV